MIPPESVDLSWKHQHRIIPSCFPPINLFETVADPEDLEIVFAIEARTNDRLRDEVGQIGLIKPEDRISGPGSSVVMAAFTHIGNPSRFTDGSFGVYYAAYSLETAIAETVYHRERFLQATDEAPLEITMRVYVGEIKKSMLDVRGPSWKHLYDPDPAHYPNSQGVAKTLRDQGAWGLVYRSVRDPGGQCIAAFRPPAVSRPKQGPHLRYVWNGTKISNVFEVKELR